jgi:hypothetical protein
MTAVAIKEIDVIDNEPDTGLPEIELIVGVEPYSIAMAQWAARAMAIGRQEDRRDVSRMDEPSKDVHMLRAMLKRFGADSDIGCTGGFDTPRTIGERLGKAEARLKRVMKDVCDAWKEPDEPAPGKFPVLVPETPFIGTRAAAKAARATYYIDGERPCPKGHAAPVRLTVNGSCVLCERMRKLPVAPTAPPWAQPRGAFKPREVEPKRHRKVSPVGKAAMVGAIKRLAARRPGAKDEMRALLADPYHWQLSPGVYRDVMAYLEGRCGHAEFRRKIARKRSLKPKVR